MSKYPLIKCSVDVLTENGGRILLTIQGTIKSTNHTRMTPCCHVCILQRALRTSNPRLKACPARKVMIMPPPPDGVGWCTRSEDRQPAPPRGTPRTRTERGSSTYGDCPGRCRRGLGAVHSRGPPATSEDRVVIAIFTVIPTPPSE
jgi:hypothetical protein